MFERRIFMVHKDINSPFYEVQYLGISVFNCFLNLVWPISSQWTEVLNKILQSHSDTYTLQLNPDFNWIIDVMFNYVFGPDLKCNFQFIKKQIGSKFLFKIISESVEVIGWSLPP